MSEQPEREIEFDDVAEQLTDRQRVFVQEYLLDLNAHKAAIRAGYSVATAKNQGSRLLSNVYISAAVHVAQTQRSKRTGVTADRVLTELALIAFSDITDVVSVTGGELTIRDMEPLPRRVKRAIESMSEKPGEHGTARSVKMHSKLAALKLLSDHLGLSAETVSKVRIAGEDGGPVEVAVTAAVVVLPAKDPLPDQDDEDEFARA